MWLNALRSVVLAFLTILLGACSAAVEDTETFTMPARFPEEAPSAPLIALEAFRDDSRFFVRYSLDGDVRFTGGDWSDRIELDSAAGGPFIVPLQYHSVDPWEDVPDELVSARILSSDDWQSFRDDFIRSVLPGKTGEGVVLHFFADDYFLYFDDEQFQSVPLTEKPAGAAIADRVSFADFVERGIPALETFLQRRGIAERRVVFNTGDTGPYSLPFLYVNLDLPVAAFARLEPSGRERAAGPVVPIVQTAAHLTRSHSSALLLRPISSVYRLFFVAKGAVEETVRPDWLIALEETPMADIHDGPGMDLVDWERQLDDLTGREASRGTIEYLVDGEAFFPRFIDAIGKAETSIDLRTYIFDNDDYAERIGELLKRRSNEGVEVRLLFDGFGTIISTIEEQETLPEDWKATSSVRAFLESDSEVEVRQTPNPWFTGDHVKTIILDRTTAFTGGMNIAREYRYDWHDLMMEVKGPVVDLLQHEFEKAWAHAGMFGDYGYFVRRMMPVRESADALGYPMRVLFTRVDDPEIFRVQRAAIRNAKSYIYVQNAYFTDDAMLYELVRARRRGVDVRVVMPLVTDRGPITRNNALAANVMLEHGIRVYVYPGMSHVKAAVFDGWACLGSANWDKWSLAINKELNLATSDPEAVDALISEVFEKDFAVSPELTEPFPERWSDFLLEFMGDYIF